ncbi:hypothetical protein [Piscicoccus intestinalis]|uniref:hypothetical protein n=1 Tax=Piscicoccus intestinalis TaxID=746033 RepID=UPI00083912E2|nr:hypothetical protein [Piscicoccus intestinalis]
MRITLDIDDVVLSAARSLARAHGVTLGAAVSELARRGLDAPDAHPGASVDTSYSPFPVLLGHPDHVISRELVNAHRDE